MPIQFQCPHCQHAMQLPDAAAGKQGKCPKCSNAVTVPAARPAAPLTPQDEEFWSEVGEKKDAAPTEEDAHKPVKRSDAQLLKKMLGKAAEAKVVKRIGMPWERPREGGMFDRYWDTAIGVMNHPTETFLEMRLTGGKWSPFVYTVVGGLMGATLSMVFGLVGLAINLFSNQDGTPLSTQTIVMCFVGGAGLLFFWELFLRLVGPFLQAAVIHGALSMVGAGQRPFEVTYRVCAFVQGSVAVCQIVPVFGNLLALILWLTGMIYGTTASHEITPNKASAGVLLGALPLLLILGVYGVALYALSFAVGVFSAIAGS